MNLILNPVAGILRGLTKVALIALTVLFLLAVLCVGLVLVMATVVRYLLTGRKPAVFTTFTQFNQAAQRFRPGQRSAQGSNGRSDSGDVVDVQAHEVRSVLDAPPRPKTAD
ncbi:MAG: hypothetical protein HYX43_19435 [Burkholderiales bacterium]|nr:hypothetical protein [Burkholderiales bacterium]